MFSRGPHCSEHVGKPQAFINRRARASATTQAPVLAFIFKIMPQKSLGSRGTHSQKCSHFIHWFISETFFNWIKFKRHSGKIKNKKSKMHWIIFWSSVINVNHAYLYYTESFLKESLSNWIMVRIETHLRHVYTVFHALNIFWMNFSWIELFEFWNSWFSDSLKEPESVWMFCMILIHSVVS